MRNKAFVGALIKTISTFIVLFALTFGYIAHSFGWFASNEDADANGSSITADNVKVEITQVDSVGGVSNNDDLSISFLDMFPGDTVSAIIDITCYQDINSLTITLSAPDGCEKPIVSEDKNYYFGSQIIISKVLYNGGELTVNAKNKTLLNDTPQNDWGVTQSIVPTDIEICTLNSLSKGTYSLELQFTFYNADYNQDVLKNFGKIGDETCYRVIKIK